MPTKKFSELTQSEINSMSKKEFNSVPPDEKRSCYDCAHLKSALSWWCGNNEAIKARGTAIPGCIKCPYWEMKKHKVKKESMISLILKKFRI